MPIIIFKQKFDKKKLLHRLFQINNKKYSNIFIGYLNAYFLRNSQVLVGNNENFIFKLHLTWLPGSLHVLQTQK